LLFLGTEHGFEGRLIPDQGHRFVTVASAPFARQSMRGKLHAISEIRLGKAASRKILQDESIDLLLSFGGYAGLPGLLAAHSLGIPIVIHEANAKPGLANRIVSRLAGAVCLGFREARSRFRGVPTYVTGNPARREIVDLAADRATDLQRGTRVLVCGGSGGSQFLNRRCPQMLAQLNRQGVSLEVTHLCGDFPLEPVREAYRSVGVPARVETFTRDMASVYRDADVGICCAGASTMAELAVTGTPALLVPLRAAAGNHQELNAKSFSASTSCPWVREQEWENERIAKVLRNELLNPVARERCRRRLLDYALPDSAQAIIRQCEAQLPAREHIMSKAA
jgi:UDP-N-acetylglucosamine--N-acetylmuramyl-(pentapeptide) pyrophosphoryl-undecaprenol N-acetylglucosamine transferase